jgi:hypothetical protein
MQNNALFMKPFHEKVFHHPHLKHIRLPPDGNLFAGIEFDGGNTPLRHDPFDITLPVSVVGGDNYHSMPNTSTVPKTFVGRYVSDHLLIRHSGAHHHSHFVFRSSGTVPKPSSIPGSFSGRCTGTGTTASSSGPRTRFARVQDFYRIWPGRFLPLYSLNASMMAQFGISQSGKTG